MAETPAAALSQAANVVYIVEKEAAFLPLILFTAFLLLIGFIVDFVLSSKKTIENWAEVRCQPHIMPIASFYGYDTMENFNYCITSKMASKANVSFAPMYKFIQSITGAIGGVIENANSMRMQLATLMGGISTIFSEFKQRFQQFSLRIQLSAQRITMLMNRVYGTMFAVIYMGLSGLTAANNLADSTVVKFLDFFCFAPETQVYVEGKGYLAVADVRIGDEIYSPVLKKRAKVTARHSFIGDGQPTVYLGSIQVSTNHYVLFNGQYIKAGEHPFAVQGGDWCGGVERPFICFNTDNNTIPIGSYIFRDYDETHTGDKQGAAFSHKSVNGTYPMDAELEKTANIMGQCAPGISADTQVKMSDGSMKMAKYLQLGDILYAENTKHEAKVIGKILEENHTGRCIIDGNEVSPATLVWRNNQWVRAHTIAPIEKSSAIYYGFIISPSSMLILNNDIIIRDHIEVCSPFAEDAYAAALSESIKIV
jgi:hypothetical protein